MRDKDYIPTPIVMDLQKILRIQVGFLTVCQLVLIITGAVYGVLVSSFI